MVSTTLLNQWIFYPYLHSIGFTADFFKESHLHHFFDPYKLVKEGLAMSRGKPDFIMLYTLFRRMDTISVSKIRKALYPNDLFYCPPFYRLLMEFNIKREDRFSWSRLVFCLPYLTHSKDGMRLGQILSTLPISFAGSHLSRILTCQYPDDIIELKHILSMVKPVIDWEQFAHTLWLWNRAARESILHDFIRTQMSMGENTKSNSGEVAIHQMV